jgi:hypothetical protein
MASSGPAGPGICIDMDSQLFREIEARDPSSWFCWRTALEFFSQLNIFALREVPLSRLSLGLPPLLKKGSA